VAGQTIGGIIIGLFIAPHFRQESEEKVQRLIRVNRIITNTMYIFLVIFLIMFSLNFISDSIDWKAVSYFAIPLVITVVVKLIYRWRFKKMMG
jgi:membrane protein YdbS with pleckstrin-like domain